MYQGSHLPNFEALGVPNSKRQTRTDYHYDNASSHSEGFLRNLHKQAASCEGEGFKRNFENPLYQTNNR